MGSNQEDWRFVAVDDPAMKARIADLYREVWRDTVERPLAEGEAATVARLSPTVRANDVEQARQARILDSVKYLVDRLELVPVLLIACSAKPVPEEVLGGRASGYYGSIFPIVWSFQLAARSRGLGTVLATAIAHRADDLAALLQLPAGCHPITMVPVAYTQGLDFRPAARGPLDQILRWDTWAGEPS
jgi:nitroreductase